VVYVGPSNDSLVDYLLVADYNQQKVYQLLLATGELRSFSTSVFTVSMALDPRRRIVYLAYETYRRSGRYKIRTSSFDGNMDFIMYEAPLGDVTLHIT